MSESFDLLELGWRSFFANQLEANELQASVPARVSSHWGSRIGLLSESGAATVSTRSTLGCGDLAVGDWILLGQQSLLPERRLERQALISRKAAGTKAVTQPIAANVDTLLVVSSCNHDFNSSRLERYLTLANASDVTPVVVLTKTDQCETPGIFRERAAALQVGLVVVSLDARCRSNALELAPWCRPGQTVALVGSSGVGKSTLASSLGAGELVTQSIREDDSKGRHTTTSRSIYPLAAGGLLIDTPGMRELQLVDCAEGLDDVFEEIQLLARECRFRDCGHGDEPGCAVAKALDSGALEVRRLENYQKLMAEQARNSQSVHQQRRESKKMGKMIKSALGQKSRRRQQEHE